MRPRKRVLVYSCNPGQAHRVAYILTLRGQSGERNAPILGIPVQTAADVAKAGAHDGLLLIISPGEPSTTAVAIADQSSKPALVIHPPGEREDVAMWAAYTLNNPSRMEAVINTVRLLLTKKRGPEPGFKRKQKEAAERV